jgi:hypothetical protein
VDLLQPSLPIGKVLLGLLVGGEVGFTDAKNRVKGAI